ncbi:NAD-P-binding protein [Trametes meyenii]|nr:NAD-P-binding protein [Trametes meyenii]
MSITHHNIAIVGGTGGLGQHISTAALTEFRSSFQTVHVLTRDPSCALARELSEKGAILHKLDESNLPRALDDVFVGVDAVVNVLPTSIIPTSTHEAVVEAVARSRAQVYFPSEFGSDYRFHDFPGYEHPIWLEKAKIIADARERLKGRKVIGVFSTVWMEYALTPILGIDVEKNAYTCYGPPSQRFSTTSTADVGRSVVRLAALSLDPASALRVPEELRIVGSTVSYEDVRGIVARVKGVARGEIESKDLTQFKNRIRQDPGQNYQDYLRVVMGEGRADFSSDNANELVNPAEVFWKWKTVEVHVRELWGF